MSDGEREWLTANPWLKEQRYAGICVGAFKRCRHAPYLVIFAVPVDLDEAAEAVLWARADEIRF